MSEQSYDSGDLVRSDRYGIGTVRFDAGATVIVRFLHGIEECEKLTLSPLLTPLQALGLSEWHSPLEVIARVQAEAIQSANDTWGIFSRSRIELLPHQLWVCRRVLETWPTRWLVADDVGLGKTIEAGLILWPLLTRGTVKRLLILTPASLVEQWQWRLKEMFDIRVARHHVELDNDRSDFWNSQSFVVASLQTLRVDRDGRQQRLLESEPWDLLLVDEAHHLNVEEHSGPTLGYKLVEQLVNRGKWNSMVFFTGTPHRGKDHGFWSLLSLLRPDLFDPKEPPRKQLPLLSKVMIRNNKQNVTDIKGEQLFQAPHVEAVTYRYSEAEEAFYQMLTNFILRGEAYASRLSGTDGRAVILVLIAVQKLASSSVAAIRRALKKRLATIQSARNALAMERKGVKSGGRSQITLYENVDSMEDMDEISDLEEEIVADALGLRLMLDEEARLQELIEAADAVTNETKVDEILKILRNQFPGRSVLLFTEYKATQSLLMSALMREFGDECVTFINGDERAEEVTDSRGRVRTFTERREDAAERFNAGEIRFLISTEAGGEGIDLQERCHTLIHIDLPWNPMRMHQRVGRLNRYGQTKRVDVVSLHNPDTVESRIWDKLNEKIANITRALSEVMDEPEDLLQLVLGMTSPSMFTELFTEARKVPEEALSDWFDRKTAQFGGRDAVEVVRELVGYAAKFDYQMASDKIPKSDLPALKPFFRLMLTLNNRQIREDDEGQLSFKTPDAWLKDPGVRSVYDNLNFERGTRGRDAAQRVVGAGHRAFDQALDQAKNFTASVATVPEDTLPRPLVIFSITDQVTTEASIVRSVVVGVEIMESSSNRILQDWELLHHLNSILGARGLRRLRSSGPPPDVATATEVTARAQQSIAAAVPELDLPFRMPLAAPLAVLWPEVSGFEVSEQSIVEEM